MFQTGQPQVAVGYLQNAAELDPNYKTPYSVRESVWTYLGRAYYEVDNFPEARRALEKALSNDKDDPLARLYLGLCNTLALRRRRGRPVVNDDDRPTGDVRRVVIFPVKL